MFTYSDNLTFNYLWRYSYIHVHNVCTLSVSVAMTISDSVIRSHALPCPEDTMYMTVI